MLMGSGGFALMETGQTPRQGEETHLTAGGAFHPRAQRLHALIAVLDRQGELLIGGVGNWFHA